MADSTPAENHSLLHRQASTDSTKNINTPVYILIIIFAISSWISISGLWIEMPLFVQDLPEGWNIPSYCIIVGQAANISILVWSLIQRITKIRETTAIYFLLATAMVTTVLIASFWQKTMIIAGSPRSVALLSLTGSLAIIDCSSTVIFFPFIARFRSASYIAAYSLGSSIGAIIPGIFGLVQGVGRDPECINVTSHNSSEFIAHYHPPLFSVSVFCYLVCGILAISTTALTLLLFVPKFNRHMLPAVSERNCSHVQEDDRDLSNSGHYHAVRPYGEVNFAGAGRVPSTESPPTPINPAARSTDAIACLQNDVAIPAMPRRQYITYMILGYWSAFFWFSFLPAMQAYTCMPYGSLTFTLTNRLSSISAPVMCIVAMRWSKCALRKLIIMTALGTLLAAYMIVLAGMSPYPVLRDHAVGKSLVILDGILMAALFAYVRVVSAMAIRVHAGAKGLFWYGGVSQAGGCTGALLSFILINVFKVFTSRPVCPPA